MKDIKLREGLVMFRLGPSGGVKLVANNFSGGELLISAISNPKEPLILGAFDDIEIRGIDKNKSNGYSDQEIDIYYRNSESLGILFIKGSDEFYLFNPSASDNFDKYEDLDFIGKGYVSSDGEMYLTHQVIDPDFLDPEYHLTEFEWIICRMLIVCSLISFGVGVFVAINGYYMFSLTIFFTSLILYISSTYISKHSV